MIEASSPPVWKRFKPFYSLLAPELAWNAWREHVLRELDPRSQDLPLESRAFHSLFRFATAAEIDAIHDPGDDGCFYSEILEVAGFRAAQGLSPLAALIRLESEATARLNFQEAFDG